MRMRAILFVAALTAAIVLPVLLGGAIPPDPPAVRALAPWYRGCWETKTKAGEMAKKILNPFYCDPGTAFSLISWAHSSLPELPLEIWDPRSAACVDEGSRALMPWVCDMPDFDPRPHW